MGVDFPTFYAPSSILQHHVDDAEYNEEEIIISLNNTDSNDIEAVFSRC